MRVVIVASELYPYAKTGGLGDFTHCLLKGLRELGVDAYACLPLYGWIDKGDLIYVGKVEVKLSRLWEYDVYRNDRVYFFDNPELFHRDYVYGPPWGGYWDNHLRFGSFCWAVCEAIQKEFLKTDVVHTNDWHTALIPLILKYIYRTDHKHVFTIHNIAYQGVFGKHVMDELKLPWELFHMDGIEFWGNVCFLKAGIAFCDVLTTVSPTHAEEIKDPRYGFGLDGFIRKHSHKLVGIVNGVDYKTWNPETDPSLWYNYTRKDLRGKAYNKRMLCKEFGLDEKLPLISYISRYAYQKGVELLLEGFERIVKLRANYFFLGSGEYGPFIKDAEDHLPNVRVVTTFNEDLSRKLYGSSDFILMPSLYEPCGITQLIGMRYGCIPIVRKTGGLSDTVKDISADGYGIVFENFEVPDLVCAVERAIDLYHARQRFLKLVKKVMSLDFSCRNMSEKYLELYTSTK
ncbi:glycogen synthase [Thermocrinis minervae]|uniref:Glycogen synthase n=1 Tax=Thermocrinis minervae TaxID=381751 RepID=A0A1M6SNR3_9AQUI|nr:glycogen/starch synthase [Thermocrinis minervae]SHK46296.1 glycogen synthase (ADP-glucose/UDP-glucose) [Thermocrinis minervae]